MKIQFDETRKKIHVTDRGRKPLRMIDLRHAGGERVFIRLASDKTRSLLSLRAPGEIDLVYRLKYLFFRSLVCFIIFAPFRHVF